MNDYKCIVRESSSGDYQWLLLDAQQQVQQSGAGSLMKLSEIITAQTPLIYVLRGSEVTHLTPQLPNMSKAKLRQALPFALEEQLANDIDHNHFAVYEQQDTCVRALVVANTTLQDLRRNLAEQSFNLQYVLAEQTFLYNVDEPAMYLGSQIAYFKVEQQTVEVVDIENLSQVFQQLAVQEHLPSHLKLWATDKAQVATFVQAMQAHQITFDVEMVDDELQFFWQQMQPILSEANILQGEFKAENKSSDVKKLWLTAAALMAATVLTALIGMSYRTSVLASQNEQLAQAILEQYQRVFPNAKSVNSPRVVLKRELEKYGSGQADFLQLLATVGEQIKSSPQITLQNLHYQREKMSLSIEASSFATLEKFEQVLKAKQLVVKQDSASSKGSAVLAQLSVSLS